MRYTFVHFLCLVSLSSIAQMNKLSFFKTPQDSLSNNLVELSFGQNLLFISPTQQATAFDQASLVIPTNSVLFYAEFRPQKTIRFPLFLNIATETKQYLVDGELVYQKANPSFGTGIVFNALSYRFSKTAFAELELAPLLSLITNKYNHMRIAPIFVSRIKLVRNDNFVMYLGVNYSFGVNAFGLMYGTGTLF